MSLDLKALQALCDAATPGPWTLATEHGSPWNIETPAGDTVALAMMLTPIRADFAQLDRHANAQFIAACREAVPALIAEAEQARTLAAAFLAYDQALTAWAAHPSATAPVDDTYATMLRLAQELVG
jgi:hypothetical protein